MQRTATHVQHLASRPAAGSRARTALVPVPSITGSPDSPRAPPAPTTVAKWFFPSLSTRTTRQIRATRQRSHQKAETRRTSVSEHGWWFGLSNTTLIRIMDTSLATRSSSVERASIAHRHAQVRWFRSYRPSRAGSYHPFFGREGIYEQDTE